TRSRPVPPDPPSPLSPLSPLSPPSPLSHPPHPIPQPPPRPRPLARPPLLPRPRLLTRPRPARLPAFPVRSPLKLQSAFPGAVGHRLHAPVVLIAGAVEHDRGDAALFRLGRDQLPQREALRGLALAVDPDALGTV